MSLAVEFYTAVQRAAEPTPETIGEALHKSSLTESTSRPIIRGSRERTRRNTMGLNQVDRLSNEGCRRRRGALRRSPSISSP